MSTSSSPSSSGFVTPVSTPPSEQTSPGKDLGILDYNGKRYKVTVIYTDENGKTVDGPEGIDQNKVHQLTKKLLDKIPDIEQSAKITIDENSVTGGEAAIPHNLETQKIWNNLYTELTTTKETKPNNNASGLSTKVILEEVSGPNGCAKIDTEENNQTKHKNQFKEVLEQLLKQKANESNPAKEQSAPSSPVEENSTTEAPDVLAEWVTTEEERTTLDASENTGQSPGVIDTEFLNSLNPLSTAAEVSSAYLEQEAEADAVKAKTP